MIIYIFIFILGLCAGSFLNAVIFRLEKKESMIFGKEILLPSDEGRCPKGGGVMKWNSGAGLRDNAKLRFATPSTPPPAPSSTEEGRWRGVFSRSHCPHCQTALKWHDLIPVFSFLFLRGQCRYCGEFISWQYPIVEIATGIIFLLILNFKFLIFNQFLMTEFLIGHWSLVIGHLLNIIYWLYIASSLIVIFVCDIKHYIIPDKILFPAIAVSIMYHVASIMYTQNYTLYIIRNTLYNHFGSALFASGFFLALVLISRGRAMGLGDVKLVFLMGLILGWQGILAALFLAFFTGAVVGLSLIFSNSMFSREQFSGKPENSSRERYYTLKSQIPFGPFLVIGTFLALFWGAQIVNWYLHMFS